jgi:SAM-dependent methyltransferase
VDEYLKTNQKLWDAWTREHEESAFYDVQGFKGGREVLHSTELAEMGDVRGNRFLHLQCHFGLDTLAWARRGSLVTGVDFSPEGIALAKSLVAELSIPAAFVCADVLELDKHLHGRFDIVFSSYGVLHWLSDLRRRAQVLAHFLKPGGFFYIVEDHPFMRVFDSEFSTTELKVANQYFFAGPYEAETEGSYATDFKGEARKFYMWDHSLGEVITSLIEAGLRIEFLHEFPIALRAKFPIMQQGQDGYWGLGAKTTWCPAVFIEGDQVVPSI